MHLGQEPLLCERLAYPLLRLADLQSPEARVRLHDPPVELFLVDFGRRVSQPRVRRILDPELLHRIFRGILRVSGDFDHGDQFDSVGYLLHPPGHRCSAGLNVPQPRVVVGCMGGDAVDHTRGQGGVDEPGGEYREGRASQRCRCVPPHQVRPREGARRGDLVLLLGKSP